MSIVLSLELLGGLVLAWQTISLTIRNTYEPLGQRVSLMLIVLVGVAWAGATLLASVRRRAWARASNLTLQVLLVAAAIGVLQGIIGEPLIGAFLLIVAVLGFIASLMVRPLEHENRPNEEAPPVEPNN